MIAKPATQHLIRSLASAFFILYSLFLSGQTAFNPAGHASRQFEIAGLSVQRSEYYRNLMLQDIAMPQQIPVDQIRLRMEYHVSYSIEKVNASNYELRIRPDSIRCNPVGYFGFDASEFLKPILSDLTFLVVNQFGFIEDSLVFAAVRLSGDAGLYLSKSFSSSLVSPSILFSSVKPVFDEDSYTRFRQDISIIDDYYAGSALLDSLLEWSEKMFPTGRESFWNYYLQYAEIGRIMQFLENSSFHGQIGLSTDPAGYWDLLDKAGRKKKRALSILQRMARENAKSLDANIESYATTYASWIISYGGLSRSADHRFGDFYSGLGLLDFSSGLINHHYILLEALLPKTTEGADLQSGLRLAGTSAARRFVLEADYMRQSGDLVLALLWYQDACAIMHAIPGCGNDSSLVAGMETLKVEMAGSYLGLARMASTRSTISVTEGYLDKAREIYSELYAPSSPQIFPLEEVEREVYSTYCKRAEEYISGSRYLLALDYLGFLLEKCSECRYDCTGDINRLTYEAKTGLYGQLLDIAMNSYHKGEMENCRETLRKAMDLRVASGSRIARDRKEAELVSHLEQDVYHEYFEEGIRYLNYQQYEIALYYLNRARSMEATTMLTNDPELPGRLQEAARPVISGMIETGRARAMGYFFSDSWEMMHSAKRMTEEYGLVTDADLNGQILAWEEQLRTYQCEKFRNDYVEMLLDARNKKENSDYISALDKVNRLIEMVLDDTLCSINDQEAWYLKAQLEYPAEFMKKQDAALKMIPGDPVGFIQAYKDLSRYYLSMKLDESGVVLVTLHQRVMAQTDPVFLDGMLNYYILQREKVYALDVVSWMWQNGHQAPTGRKQKELATWLAMDDLSRKGADPIECLHSYVPVDKAFSIFRNKYKYTWLKGSGWKVRYLSLFLKNKSGQD